jgi:hypothetical protein
VVRHSDAGIKFENLKFEYKPAMYEMLAVEHRSPRARMITLADGTKAEPVVTRPHSLYPPELFKIKDEEIEQIEANLITAPYHMPSPWDDWAHEGRLRVQPPFFISSCR